MLRIVDKCYRSASPLVLLTALGLLWTPPLLAQEGGLSPEEIALLEAEGVDVEGLGFVEDETPSAAGDEAPPVTTAPALEAEAEPRELFETEVRASRPAQAASDFRLRLDERPLAARAQITSLMRLAPGLHLSQHSGEGKADQIFLRGFDAIHGQDVEVVVAGIPINEPSNVHGQGYADLHFVIPELVLALRAIEGVYDLEQGDFAVAGSLRLRLGMAERGVLVHGGLGRFGQWRTLVAWGPSSQPAETFVAVDYEAGDGFGPSRAWSRVRGLGQAVIDLPRCWSLRLLASSYVGRFDSAGVLRLDDLEAGEVGRFESYDPDQGGFSARHQGLLEVRHQGDRDRTSLAIWGGYRDLRLRQNFTGFIYETEAQPGQVTTRPGDLNEQLNQFVELGLDGSYRRLELPWRWIRWVEAGIRVRHDRIDQSQRRLRRVDRSPWLAEVDAELELTSIGAWLGLELRPARWLAVRGGLRLDALAVLIHDHLGFDGLGGRRDAMGIQPSPRVTIEGQPASWLSVFASYGRGLRSPQALSLGDGERAPLTTVDSGELGLALRSAAGELRLAGFATYIEQDLIFDHSTGRSLATGETLRAGVALALSARLARWARVSANLTWTRASSLDTGVVVPYAPPIVGRAEAVLGAPVARLWRRGLRLEAVVSLSVVGPRPLPFDERSRSVVLVDTAASIRLGEVELGVNLRNLLDRRWRDGEFVYVSTFDPEAEAPSLVPARHVTTGYPLRVTGYLALHL